MVYILYAFTTFYDFDTHYDDVILGIYSSKDKAEEALKRYETIDFREELPFCDEYELQIEEYEIDKDLRTFLDEEEDEED